MIKPLLNREEVSKRGLLLPKGILIYGPSGVGKTSLGFAIANELGFASINVDVSLVDNGTFMYSFPILFT